MLLAGDIAFHEYEGAAFNLEERERPGGTEFAAGEGTLRGKLTAPHIAAPGVQSFPCRTVSPTQG